ncbi:acetylornithine deacetylase [Azospirillum sp. RWY-5-1]|uniref:Acetylornithine deacetylase n=1 Tax=Azospirillum oleiclasticum TaxID=2735135 RepID=A0ABX2T535_9PROT|nr:acetylornithine deacetylase [Azospirillum oleiclasticum]NYZ12267.1 acetylornithine deacetylase [Azospirillum oleiclasticum]NYZ19427.1 acetylornithine deacetylase [Azospirillum oleiclasticum]
MTVIDILERLVAVPSVVGTPNHAIVDGIRAILAEAGARVHILPGPEGDRSNLFATIGPAMVPGYVLSGHMDVVPAGEAGWTGDPFRLRAEDDRLYGRGTSDMKGFIAAALAALPALTAAPLARPIHMAFTYDEEAGCQGAPHLLPHLPALCAPPLGVIVGEPSGLRAIRAHKGKAAARLTIQGRAGHSSRPDQGLNAIHAMSLALSGAVAEAERLTAGPLDAVFEPPCSTLQVGTIRGGQAVNVIPDSCTAELEARAIAGVDPAALLAPVRRAAERLSEQGFTVEWTGTSAYPALSLPAASPLALLLEELTGQTPLAAVSYGTEAGLYQTTGVDAIICGPGDIARAHRPDEYILTGELLACQSMIERLGARCRL